MIISVNLKKGKIYNNMPKNIAKKVILILILFSITYLAIYFN